jgi:hypothetical protein
MGKIYILHPHEGIISGDIELKVGYDLGSKGKKIKSHKNFPEENTRQEYSGPSAYFVFEDYFYAPEPSEMQGIYQQFNNPAAADFARRACEVGWGGLPPAKITFDVSEDASPGDYEVFVTHAYNNNIGYLTDRKSVEFYIKTPVEELQPTSTYLRNAGAVAAVLSLIVVAAGTILEQVVISLPAAAVFGLLVAVSILISADMYIGKEDYWEVEN